MFWFTVFLFFLVKFGREERQMKKELRKMDRISRLMLARASMTEEQVKESRALADALDTAIFVEMRNEHQDVIGVIALESLLDGKIPPEFLLATYALDQSLILEPSPKPAKKKRRFPKIGKIRGINSRPFPITPDLPPL